MVEIRHYEKSAEEIGKLQSMHDAKAYFFINLKTQKILELFEINNIKNIWGVGNGVYGSENLHEIDHTN